MTTTFEDRLAAAKAAGKVAAKRAGVTVKALVLRLMDSGASDPVDILLQVLEQRDELPEWARRAPRHELAAVLTAWGSVRHAMRQHRKRPT